MRERSLNGPQLAALRDSLRAEERARRAAHHRQILLCAGAGCIASGSLRVKCALEKELELRGMTGRVAIVQTGCLGPCSGGPVIRLDDVLYEKVKPQDAPEIVSRAPPSRPGRPPLDPQACRREARLQRPGHRFLQAADEDRAPQLRPDRSRSGSRTTSPATATRPWPRSWPQKNPEAVIETLQPRGCGAAAGPASPPALKWQFARRRRGRARRKYVVCNADEGDPGRLHGPQRAGRRPAQRHRGHGHRRATHRRARRVHLRPGRVSAGRRAPRASPWSRPGSAACWARTSWAAGFDFDLEIRMGSGAFVCGEETALLTSIEGNRGEPRPRPPFPAERASGASPPLLNNVETYANVPAILLNGGEWYAALRHREEQGHQGLRPGRRDQEHRPGRSARGHAAGRPDLRHRRRHPRRQGVQGRADRRPLRRLHPQAAPQRAAGLRVAGRAGRDHGLRRPDRHGRR